MKKTIGNPFTAMIGRAGVGFAYAFGVLGAYYFLKIFKLTLF